MKESKIVKIQRGKYSADFQLVRALLMAASACLHQGDDEAVGYIDRAIMRLTQLRLSLVGE